ncbi:restriction endonuclease [Oceanobacillus massiliensis]|uniref:restriction endonuclease n=1 Tax=Oceanobacillus massiliensis TaxID=1465765 RepID=UPI0030166D39
MLASKFDTERFIEKKNNILDTANLIGKDIGKAYLVKYDEKSKARIKPCYILTINETVYVMTGYATWKKLNLKDIINAYSQPSEFKKYGEMFLRIKNSGEKKKDSYYIGSYLVSKQVYIKPQIICLTTEKGESLLNTKKEIKKKKEEIKLIESKKNEEEKINIFSSYTDMSMELLKDKTIYLMIYNFLDQLTNNSFLNITNFDIYEDYLKSNLLGTPEKSNYRINYQFRDFLDSRIKKLKMLLIKKKYFSKELKEIEGNYVILKALEFVAIDYYSSQFEDAYSGYFVNLKKMNLKQCANTFFSIDLIDNMDGSNISLFTYFLIKNKKINKPKNLKRSFLFYSYNKIKRQIDNMIHTNELDQFEAQLLKRKSISTDNITIDDVDLMNGQEFEEFIYNLFKKMGYSVNKTKATGDQGIDVIAVKRGHRIGIQTKCYSSSVSNKAIQEVVAGMKFYNLAKGMVITNNYFTKSAVELGNSGSKSNVGVS